MFYRSHIQNDKRHHHFGEFQGRKNKFNTNSVRKIIICKYTLLFTIKLSSIYIDSLFRILRRSLALGIGFLVEEIHSIYHESTVPEQCSPTSPKDIC